MTGGAEFTIAHELESLQVALGSPPRKAIASLSPAGAAALTPASYGGSTIAASATAVRRQDGSGVPVGLAMPPYATPASWASPG